MEKDKKPNPDELLAQINIDEAQNKKGKLKLYIGMCAGVGKTFSMLQDANKAIGKGIDALIGYVETHKRSETEFLLFYLPQLPRKKVEYKGFTLEEMDTDAILVKKPKLVIVDELAHTNAPGSRHKKRYLDVLELLDNGIDVYSAVNVQHIESLADTVARITGVIIKETVPDSILDIADEIELVDISPDELLQRLQDGKVYTADKTKDAVNNFFRKGNLSALRELSLRITADRVDKQVRDYMQKNKIPGPWKSSQRILIGVSQSPSSADLIRWARRISYTMDASWIAVYIETPKKLDEKQILQLNKNLDLAKELGAEIISSSDVDIVEGIIRISKRENVTHIVIGKSINKNIFTKLFRTDIVNRVLNKCGNIDVYVVSGDIPQAEKKKFFNIPKTQSAVSNYIYSSLIIFIVTAICYPMSEFLGYRTIALILLLVVSFLPLILGPGPVLLAAVLSPLLWNYFFVPPKFTLMISRGEDLLMFVLFFIIAYVTGVLTTRIREREKAVRQREERAIALYNIANDLSKTKNLKDVINSSAENFKKVFKSDVSILLFDENKKRLLNENLPISDKEFSVAEWVCLNGKRAGKYTDSLPSAELIYYPLKGPRGTVGVIGLHIDDEILFREQESLIENFIKQTSSAIERELLNQKANKAIVVEESEKLYKTLFDSISHELKTPIAAIMGASSFLLQKNGDSKPESRIKLYDEIHTATIRLNRLVENLLDMARLESGRLVPNFQTCDIGDLINSAVKQFQKELLQNKFTIKIADDMPFIKLDFPLMEQVLVNILQNAILYNPDETKIEIQAEKDNSFAYIIISDNGKGIPDEHLENIFEKFYRVDSKISGGTGLGLSIAKGIVEANKGTITAQNKKTGGLKFTIKLPVNI